MDTAVASLPPAVLSRFDESFGELQYRETLRQCAADPRTPLGVLAIGQVGSTCAQNAKALPEYTAALS